MANQLHSPPTACKHTVSGTISLPSPGFFSPFPHGTSSLSVASEYLALEDGPPGFPRDYTCPAVLGNRFQRDQTHFGYGTITLYGYPFQGPSPMSWFDNSPGFTPKRPHNPDLIAKFGLGSSLFARRYLENLDLISLPGGTEMFHFPPSAFRHYEFMSE